MRIIAQYIASLFVCFSFFATSSQANPFVMLIKGVIDNVNKKEDQKEEPVIPEEEQTELSAQEGAVDEDVEAALIIFMESQQRLHSLRDKLQIVDRVSQQLETEVNTLVGWQENAFVSPNQLQQKTIDVEAIFVDLAVASEQLNQELLEELRTVAISTNEYINGLAAYNELTELRQELGFINHRYHKLSEQLKREVAVQSLQLNTASPLASHLISQIPASNLDVAIESVKEATIGEQAQSQVANVQF